MEKVKNSLRWLDNNIFKLLFIGFIFLIPLYPKFPLVQVNFTYIAIRLEDVYFALMSAVFFIQLLRKKLAVNTKMLKIFILFWSAVFISFLFGYYVLKTVEFFHIGLLHSLRRVEYMLPFLYAASLIKSDKDALFYLKLFLTATLLISLYGIGQKYFGLPAVQTMNPEYAKGRLLFLTPEARISSTFAGHYDLAAYLIFFIPLILAMFFYQNQKRYYLLAILSIYTLVLTASRISFIAYLLSAFPLLLILRKYKQTALLIAITIVMLYLNKNVLHRFTRTFQVKKVLINEKTGQIYIPQKIRPDELPAGSFAIKVDENKFLEKIAKEKTSEKELIQAEKEAIRDIALQIGLSTQEANLIAETQNIEKLKEKAKHNKELAKKLEALKPLISKKTIAENTQLARKYLKPATTILSDISFATRLQVEWPRALGAFISSPLLGFGASALTEATDNDYLRWLGEFGIIGTAIFLYILIKKLLLQTIKFYRKSNSKFKTVVLGYAFGLWALLINASYIDVFEASKVAFTFWMLSGIIYPIISKKTFAK